MGNYLRKSTASQEILLGPFLDDTDGKTAETGLTISNTDIKIWKHGGTTEASKNSGGATHIAAGRYYAVLDATDTDTVGLLEVNVHVAGALPVLRRFTVLAEQVFDSLMGSDLLDVNVSKVAETSQTGRDIGASVLVSSGSGAGQVDLSSGKVLLQATQTGVTIPTVTNLTNAPPAVTLAASQPNYAPAKAGDAMALTSGERTTLVWAVWDALLSGLTTVGSIGKKLADWVIGTTQTADVGTVIENVGGPRLTAHALEQSPAGADQSAVKRLIARNLGKDLVSVRGWTGIKVVDTLVDGQTGEDDNGATFVFYAVDPADVSSKVELGTFVFSAGTIGDGTAENPGNGTFTPSGNFAYPNYPGKDLYLAIVCSVSSQAHDGAHLEDVNMHGHRFQVVPVGYYPMDPGDGSGGVTAIVMNGLEGWMYWVGADGWARAEDHGQLYNQPTLGAVLAFPDRGYGSGIGLPGGALVLGDIDLDEPVTMTKLRQQALVNPQGIESLSVAGYETIGTGYIRIAVQGTVDGAAYYQKLGTVDATGFHADAGWTAIITPDVSTLRLVIDRGTDTEACHLVFTAVDGGGNRRTIHYQHPGGAVSLALAGDGGAYNYDGTWPHEPPVPASGTGGGGADVAAMKSGGIATEETLKAILNVGDHASMTDWADVDEIVASPALSGDCTFIFYALNVVTGAIVGFAEKNSGDPLVYLDHGGFPLSGKFIVYVEAGAVAEECVARDFIIRRDPDRPGSSIYFRCPAIPAGKGVAAYVMKDGTLEVMDVPTSYNYTDQHLRSLVTRDDLTAAGTAAAAAVAAVVTGSLVPSAIQGRGALNAGQVREIYRGDVETIPFTLSSDFDLSAGQKVYLCAKEHLSDANTLAIVNRECTVLNPTTRSCSITLTVLETASVGMYHAEYSVTASDGSAPRVAIRERWKILDDVRK
jgi:hypothetical protein